MSQFKVCSFDEARHIAEGSWQPEADCLDEARQKSIEQPGWVFSVFERVDDFEAHYRVFYQNGKVIPRYTLYDGDRVVIITNRQEEQGFLYQRGCELSLTSPHIRLTDAMEVNAVVFRDGDALNPDFGNVPE